MGLLGEFGELLLPRRCAGCGRESVYLCTSCLQLLGGIPRAMEPRYGRLPIIGLCEYDSRISRMVVGFKDEGRRDALARSIVAALDLTGYIGGGIRLCPAPSSDRARRRRGGSHTVSLAERASELSPELPLEVHDVLLARGTRDQVGLGAHDRARNVARTQYLDHAELAKIRPNQTRSEASEPSVDLVVDDFSTTGATLAESTRLLASVQIRPAAGVVLGLGRGGTRFVSPFTV